MSGPVWRFAGFTYSPETGLERDGAEVRIGPQARQLLELLLEAKGGVVSRQQIGDRLWVERSPSDESIDRCVYLLRKPLREAGFGDLVATAYGRGLSLRAKVEVIGADAAPAPSPAQEKCVGSPVATKAIEKSDVGLPAPMVELAVGDIVVRVGPGVTEDQLARILRAARAARAAVEQ